MPKNRISINGLIGVEGAELEIFVGFCVFAVFLAAVLLNGRVSDVMRASPYGFARERRSEGLSPK